MQSSKMETYDSHSSIQLPHGAKLRRENALFKRELILLDIIGQEIVATIKGSKLEIEFLKHSYSVVVEICIGDFSTTIDLFSEDHTKFYFSLDVPPNASSVIIRLLDSQSISRESGSLTNEVWIGRISFNNPFSPAEINVTPINELVSLVNGKYGSFMILNTDVGASRTILHEGVWAEHDIKLFSRFIKPGMTVYEVGAHIGHHSVVFSRLCGTQGKVHAFEPQNYLFKILNTNLLINNCHNATAYRLALGSEKSKAKLWPIDYTQNDNFGGLSISQKNNQKILDHDGEDINITTGDDFVSDIATAKSSIDFIKIDAQSFELYILQGFANTLKNRRPMLFLEIEPFYMQSMGYHYSEIFNLLYALKYKIYLPHDSLESPIEAVPKWDVKNKEIGCDILALPA